MTLVCICGPDGVGKSTLAKNLANRLGYARVTMKIPNRNCIENLSYVYSNALADLAHLCDIVSDRGLLTPIVYSKIFKRKQNHDYVKKLIKKCGDDIFFILILPETPFRKTDDVLKNRTLYNKALKEYYKMLEYLQKLNCKYIAITEKFTKEEMEDIAVSTILEYPEY